MALPFTDYTSNIATSTDNVVTGDGIFDDLMETVTAHIEAQRCEGRITGPQYSEVYLGAMQATMQTAAKIFLERQITEDQCELLKAQKLLVDQQILESVAKTALIDQQKLTEIEKTLLVIAQTLGFSVDAKQKVLKQMLESWAVAYSVAQSANPIPESIKVPAVDALQAEILNDLP